MPLELPEDLRTPLVICGISGKRHTGVRDFHELLKPLVLQGKVTVVPRDGLCSLEALNRYVKWASATFFIRIEASEEVRLAKGWRKEFGPEDFVRDYHWTETALDKWDGWDAVIYHDGDEETLLARANELAPKINALVANPSLSKHKPIPEELLPKTEHTTAIPDFMVPGWGVNPPKKNAEGQYEFNASPSGKPQEMQGAEQESRRAPTNDALQAATARAASASTRWEEGAEGANAAIVLEAAPKPDASAGTSAFQNSGIPAQAVTASSPRGESSSASWWAHGAWPSGNERYKNEWGSSWGGTWSGWGEAQRLEDSRGRSAWAGAAEDQRSLHRESSRDPAASEEVIELAEDKPAPAAWWGSNWSGNGWGGTSWSWS